MNITGQCIDGVLTLRFAGELDHHAAREAMQALLERIDAFQPSACRLDLSGLSFMDSSGIALILRAARQMQELAGELQVSGAPAQARRVLDAAGIGRLVTILP